MQTIWQDVILAARLLRKAPGFAVAAVFTLALGIGANATIFSYADAVLLRKLPVPEADRIVHIYQRRPGSTESYPLAYADYRDYAEQSQSFEILGAHYPGSPMHLVVNGEPQSVNGSVVTATYFDLLRIQPAHGRFFSASEDRVPDRDAVAVISHGLWTRTFGAAADVVGQTIRVNDHAFTIVGVAPRGFSGVHNGGVATEVWIPSAMFRIGYRFCDAFTRGCTITDMIGKLKPGVTVAHAQHELDVIATRLATAYPATNGNLGVRIVEARGRGYGRDQNPAERQQLLVYFVGVGVVLLIGCANIAGLLLARAIGRRKEIAVRLAIGATRFRLIRQLFTESVLIAVLGASAGFLIAFWGKDLVSSLEAADYAGRPRDLRTDLSGAVFLVTVVITVCATILFGLVPALQASKPDILPALKDESTSGGATRAKLRKALVIGQFALAVTLLVGAILLMRSVDKVLAGPGFDPRPLITLRLRPGLLNYPTEKALAFQRDVIARLEALPGVLSVSPGDGTVTTPMQSTTRERQTRVGPNYFATLGVRVVEGREFDGRDTATAHKTVVVNDVMARRFSPDGSAVGKLWTFSGQSHEIIGVVQDAQYYGARQAPQAVVYRAYWQPDANGGFNRDSRTLVRVSGAAAAMMPSIRRAIAAVDPAVPISEDYPLSQRVKYEFQPVERARILISGFALVAVLLSAVGLYAVLAFAVGQRTREIGVRMALGASSSDVARLVVRDGLGMTLLGAALGIVAAWMSARVVDSLLYGVDPRDPMAFFAAPAVLIGVALLACYLPARRAARVLPTSALRYE